MEGLPPPGLPGPHQSANAAAALTVLDALRDRLPLRPEPIARGLRSAGIPGRFQSLQGRPEWIFDVAHNPDAAAVLAAGLRGQPQTGRLIAVVGVLADKDIAGVFAPLLPLVDTWIVSALAGPRGLDADATIAHSGAPASATANWLRADSVEAACERATKVAAPRDRILVFGSFHTVGPALQWKGAVLPFGPAWNPESKNV
jgi:dihydrofolate synthase/folylpolyglutamate synthase